MKIWGKKIKDESLINWVVDKEFTTFYYDFGNNAKKLGRISTNEIVDDWLEHEKESRG